MEEHNLESTSDNVGEIVESPTNDVEMIEKEKYVRLYSEFENYKRRTQKEKEEYIKNANQKVLLDIIFTIDNFERAGELEQGMKLIYDGLKKTLDKYGVKELSVKGLKFNSDTMEALSQVPSGSEFKEKVIDVIEKGYELNGKIIRFAKVIVGL